MYTAYLLTDDSHADLLERFPPKYEKIIGNHVTVKFGVPEDAALPDDAWLKVIGEADSGDGLQTLVVSVDGAYRRPDGKIYHITWSLNPEEYKPVDSNELLADYSNRWKLGLPVSFDATPSILK